MSQIDKYNEFILRYLKYNPVSGEFIWLINRGNKAVSGSVAGTITNTGYRRIKILGKLFLAHRIAWFISYGFWPKDQIDHINGVRNDNRIENLREADASLNLQNRKYGTGKHSCGLLGITWHKRDKKWQASIRKNKKVFYIGYFDTKEEAYLAYVNAKRRMHPGSTI